MKTDQVFKILALIMVHCQALPTETADNAIVSKTKDFKSTDDNGLNETLRVEDDPGLNGGYFEGDMVITRTYNGAVKISQRWPNGVVYYRFNSIFDIDHVLHILQGMQIIETRSCIRFLPAADTTKAFIEINGAFAGCYSEIGYTGRKQVMNFHIDSLGIGCFKTGSILHEFFHALGFYHQHNVPERDSYIKIVTENIVEGEENNFKKNSNKTVTSFGFDYDYHSVMHYNAKSFSKNGNATIIALKNVQFGEKNYLSEYDGKKLNIMYNCQSMNSKSV